MNNAILALFQDKEIVWERGLSDAEFQYVWQIYHIEFPLPLKSFLKTALPVSRGFYNWRDFREENINRIKKCMLLPIREIFDRADEVDWYDGWGEEPVNPKTKIDEIQKKVKAAPRLIPIYAHRYMPLCPLSHYPILSIHGLDVIYYAKNLEDYFEREFGSKTRDTLPDSAIEKIPFWTDLM
jgi:hypothetical protein